MDKTSFSVRVFLQRFGLVIAFIILCIVLTALSDQFLTLSNARNILRQSTINGIISVGMTMVILTPGIDLSVGSVLALTGVVVADLVQKGWAIWGTGKMGPIPVPVVVLAVIFVAAYIVLSRTKFGLHVYAVGGHQETARLAGINIGLVTTAVYVISGLTAALAGIITAARLWLAQPNVPAGLELDAIAASVLGGISLFGGVGCVGGTIVGAFIMGVLNNGLNLPGVSSYYQKVIKGFVFILAVLLDLYTKGRK